MKRRVIKHIATGHVYIEPLPTDRTFGWTMIVKGNLAPKAWSTLQLDVGVVQIHNESTIKQHLINGWITIREATTDDLKLLEEVTS